MGIELEVAGLGWVTAAGLGRGHGPGLFSRPAGDLPAVRRKDVFAEAFPRFGRLDEFSRVGLAAVALALTDAGMENWREKRPVALVASSRYGCLATDADYFTTVQPAGGQEASPNLFAYTLPNSFLGEAAIRFGLCGPAFVTGALAGGDLAGLGMAAAMIAAGESDVAVAGCCDVVRPVFLTADRGPDRPGAIFLVLCLPGGERSLARLLFADGFFFLCGRRVVDLDSLVAGIMGSPAAGRS